MSDLISRQAAIDAINSHFGFNIEEEYGSAVQEVINGLPSAQVRKMGRWINKKYRWVDSISMWWKNSYECSNCGAAGIRYWMFCPNCGAKMEVENDE